MSSPYNRKKPTEKKMWSQERFENLSHMKVVSARLARFALGEKCDSEKLTFYDKE